MKILVLTSTFPRWEGDTEPRFVYDLARRCARDHHVDVLTPHTRGAKPEEHFSGLNVFRFRYAPSALEVLGYNGGILWNLKRHPWSFALLPAFFILNVLKLYKLNGVHNYDIIHAHWIVPQGLTSALFTTLFRRTPPVVVATSHGGDLFAFSGRLSAWLKRFVLRRTDHLTVVSRALYQEARHLGVSTNRLSIQPMGTDLRTLFVPPAADVLRRGIIYVGRLVEKKGVAYLIKAMAIVVKARPDITLTIVGTGPLEHELKALVQKLALGKSIEFTGTIDHTRIRDKLQRASIAVIPSIIAKSGDQEGFGLTIAEAMGCECAVVASDLPAVRDLIENNKTGLLTPQKDTVKLAEHICRLLDDESFRTSLARNGRQFAVNQFDWSTVVNGYIELFTSLTAASRHSA